MKKVTLTDLSGKEIEVYFADDKTAASAEHSDEYKVNIEDIPSNKNWFDMTGGASGKMFELDINKNSAWCGAGDESCGAETKKNLYQKLDTAWLKKVKKLEESGSQIKIDDTIPSDFVDASDLRGGSIYKVAGLGLTAKFVGCRISGQQKPPSEQKPLLKMKRHGTVFYVEEGQLMKATTVEVSNYLNEPF
tara:strand:- start:1245 stop:1817 length:573 start_codon:yes stop_codon:yes gene_type:complete